MTNKPKNLSQFIKKGKYDYVNSDINDKNFPDFIEMPNEETELIHFNEYISSEKAIERLKEKGMRPANLKELLQFGIDYPEKQREFPIVALGSVWQRLRGDRSVPCLWGGADGRRLSLSWFGSGWVRRCRFAAVRLDGNKETADNEKDESIKENKFSCPHCKKEIRISRG